MKILISSLHRRERKLPPVWDEVVIDTDVLISAAIEAQSVPSLAVHRAAQRGVQLKSGMTEADLMEVIDRPYLRPRRATGWCN